MRKTWRFSLPALAVLALSAPAWAEPTPEAKAPALGVSLDVGVPDGIGANLLYRPAPALRFMLGATYLAAAGVHGGVTLIPLPKLIPFIQPSFTAEGGYVFQGATNAFIRHAVYSSGAKSSQTFSQVSYGYANAHAGLELGFPDRLQLFIHAGISYLTGTIRDFQSVARSATNDPTLQSADPTFTAVVPSAKAGFIFYF